MKTFSFPVTSADIKGGKQNKWLSSKTISQNQHTGTDVTYCIKNQQNKISYQCISTNTAKVDCNNSTTDIKTIDSGFSKNSEAQKVPRPPPHMHDKY